ncbi:AMP-binding protein [Thalassococcus sp. S3]|uniref:non-ribosomal peptide synthetase n=1 Tax=Thalassococcus sp. S3 TaxID=2017482 RepID=UPI0013EE900F|nr:AMP-binding protein [Thalassococcus sp. S3]
MSKDSAVSPEQFDILLHEATQGTKPGYCIAHQMSLSPPIDDAQISAALQKLSERHELLRSDFSTQGSVFLRHVAQRIDVDYAHVKLPSDTTAAFQKALNERSDQIVALPFDTAKAPLWRVRRCDSPDGETVLLFFLHHTIADGWSMKVLMTELIALLSDRADTLEPAPDYRTYAQATRPVPHQSEQNDGEIETHWPSTARDETCPAEAAGRVERRLAPDLGARLMGAAKQLRATPHLILLAAWTAVVVRYTRTGVVPLLSVRAARETKALEHVVGPIYQARHIAFDVDETRSFAEHVAHTRRMTAQPSEDDVMQSSHRGGFFTFGVHQGGETDVVSGGRHFRHFDRPISGAIGDVDVFLYDEPKGWRMLLCFGRRIMGEADAKAVISHFETLLDAALEDPTTPCRDLPISETHALSRAEAWINGPEPTAGDQGFVTRFEERATADPDRVAIVWRDREMTFATARRHVHRLHEQLAKAGIAAGSRVGILAPKCPALPLAQLAIRRHGCSFVPLDRTAPPDRLRVIAEEAQLSAVLCCEGGPAASLPCPALFMTIDGDSRSLAAEPDPPAPTPDDLEAEAYVLFTSGSTGTPKGVRCTERGLIRVFGDMGVWRIADDDIVLSSCPPTFDVSLFEMCSGLLVADRLVIAETETSSTDDLADLIKRSGATFASVVPRLFHDLVHGRPDMLDGLRTMVVGGDVNSADDFRRCLEHAPHLSLFGGYGPTEAGVWTTGWQGHLEHEGPNLPIGTPVAGTRVAVVDRLGRPCPPGVVGELVIGGPCVAMGYVKPLPTNTFRPDPLDKDALSYHTGDLVRLEADGKLAFLGRGDRQVKVGAYRIEPAEIETAALASGQIDNCAVFTLRKAAGAELHAAIVPKDPDASAQKTRNAVRESLLSRLPAYMVPSHLMLLSQMPATAHGKTDVARLQALAAEMAPEGDQSGNEVEKLVLDTVCDVLGQDRIDLDANFYAVGGYSLAAVDISRRLAGILDRDVPVRVLLQSASLRDFAVELRVSQAMEEGLDLPDLGQAEGPVPASDAQRRHLKALAERDRNLPALPLVFELSAPVEPAMIDRAVAALVSRHPILRTGFKDVSPATPPILQTAPMPKVRVIDLGPDQSAEARCQAELAVRNDVGQYGPLRPILLRQETKPAILLLVLDHVSHDGQSLHVIRREFHRLLAAELGERLVLPPPPELSYIDYAAWEALIAKRGLMVKAADMRRVLPKASSPWPERNLVTAQEAQPQVVTVGSVPIKAADWRKLARTCRATLFTTVMTLTARALFRCLDTSALRIGFSITARTDPRLLNVVGPLANHSIVDINQGSSLEDACRNTQSEVLEAQNFAFVPLRQQIKRGIKNSIFASYTAFLPDAFFSLFEAPEMPETADGPVRSLDAHEGWDPQDFTFSGPVTILSVLYADRLTLRIGVHPAVVDLFPDLASDLIRYLQDEALHHV